MEVTYNGSRAGVVANNSAFEQAKTMAVSCITGATESDFEFKGSDLRRIATLKKRFTSTKAIADAIIDHNDDVVWATEILVDGSREICVDNFDVNAYLNKCLQKYDIAGAENKSSFTKKIEVNDCYCLTDELSSVQQTVKFLSSLPVKTTSTFKTRESIPYTTVTEKTAMQYVGFSSVITRGAMGIREKTQSIVSINGKEKSNKILGSEIISQPVNEVVLIGTKARTASANLGLIFPMPRGSYTITSYYGDGRNHQGVDLAADRGTSIFAVKSGTVTYSGSNGNYGYCVIIDHGNGIKSLYAHNDKNLVSVGEKVNAGQTIALVGSTGRSTGNHLHFEVIVNGSNIDPAPYIGLY